jgi:hypothetical protein
MFKELPAWAIFAKHATNLQFSDLTMVCLRKDFRVPVVLDNVSNSTFSGLKITQQGKKKDIYQNNCKGITIK